jgi:hypothetical protein
MNTHNQPLLKLTSEQLEALRKLENPTILKFSNGLIMVDKATILRFEDGKSLSPDQTKFLNMSNSPVGPAILTGAISGVVNLVVGAVYSGQFSTVLALSSGGASVAATVAYIGVAAILNRCLTSKNPDTAIYCKVNFIDKSDEKLPAKDEPTLHNILNEFENHNIATAANPHTILNITPHLSNIPSRLQDSGINKQKSRSETEINERKYRSSHETAV